jgi:dimeric dUTPase (all-alpha-NTP-PPase superfamily)
MELTKLYQMQRGLDSHIESNHQLENDHLIEKKILALLVEIGELANETRCFKFWSLKPPAPREIILEEFVDGIHFILSLGLECGFEQNEFNLEIISSNDLTEQFLTVFSAVNHFKQAQSMENYQKMFGAYLNLAKLLGFSHIDIEQAYISKNEVNYERQQKGY